MLYIVNCCDRMIVLDKCITITFTELEKYRLLKSHPITVGSSQARMPSCPVKLLLDV